MEIVKTAFLSAFVNGKFQDSFKDQKFSKTNFAKSQVHDTHIVLMQVIKYESGSTSNNLI